MANKLVKCPVCGQAVSSGAPVCPKCGEKIKAGKQRCKWLGFVGIVMSIGCVAAIYTFDAMGIDVNNHLLWLLSLIGLFLCAIGFSAPIF